MQANTIKKVTRCASVEWTPAMDLPSLTLNAINSVISNINDHSTTSHMNRKLTRFSQELSTLDTFGFDPIKLSGTL